jgi:hypothetical protein
LGTILKGIPVIKVIEELWHKALQTEDMDMKKQTHVLEISPHNWMTFKQSDRFHNEIVFSDSKAYFRGLFLIKIIYEPLYDFDITKVDPEVKDIDHFQHLSFHVERTNGRMVYYDWDGNDKRVM